MVKWQENIISYLFYVLNSDPPPTWIIYKWIQHTWLTVVFFSTTLVVNFYVFTHPCPRQAHDMPSPRPPHTNINTSFTIIYNGWRPEYFLKSSLWELEFMWGQAAWLRGGEWGSHQKNPHLDPLEEGAFTSPATSQIPLLSFNKAKWNSTFGFTIKWLGCSHTVYSYLWFVGNYRRFGVLSVSS